jgi:hypothetical protein
VRRNLLPPPGFSIIANRKEVAMRALRPGSLQVLFLAAGFALSCGGGSNRQLQSISISAVADGLEVSFMATGTYNAAPITVTPLPASWFVGDPTGGYQLTTQPFTVVCGQVVSASVNVIAPVDPNAPTSGMLSGTKMVTASSPILCP